MTFSYIENQKSNLRNVILLAGLRLERKTCASLLILLLFVSVASNFQNLFGHSALPPVFQPVTAQAQTRHWAFASLNPNQAVDDEISKGATGVAFWAYKATGADTFSDQGSLHSFHVNVALGEGTGCGPSFHYGFLVSPTDPQSGSPSIHGTLTDCNVADGSTTRWDIKIPRGDMESRSWYLVQQDGQDSSGKWKWDFSLYVKPLDSWINVTTLYMDSGSIARSPNMNAEISEGGGVTACNDRFTPVSFYRVHVFKDGSWQNIPFLVVDYTSPDRNGVSFEDCPAMDWNFVDAYWATASTGGRHTPRGTLWSLEGPVPEFPNAGLIIVVAIALAFSFVRRFSKIRNTVPAQFSSMPSPIRSS